MGIRRPHDVHTCGGRVPAVLLAPECSVSGQWSVVSGQWSVLLALETTGQVDLI